VVTITIHITMQVCKVYELFSAEDWPFVVSFMVAAGSHFSLKLLWFWTSGTSTPVISLWWIESGKSFDALSCFDMASFWHRLAAHSAFFLIDYIMLFLLRQCQTIQNCKILEATKDSRLVDCLIPKTYEYNKRTNHKEDIKEFWKRYTLYIP